MNSVEIWMGYSESCQQSVGGQEFTLDEKYKTWKHGTHSRRSERRRKKDARTKLFSWDLTFIFLLFCPASEIYCPKFATLNFIWKMAPPNGNGPKIWLHQQTHPPRRGAVLHRETEKWGGSLSPPPNLKPPRRGSMAYAEIFPRGRGVRIGRKKSWL